jgi:hypothetical protein
MQLKKNHERLIPSIMYDTRLFRDLTNNNEEKKLEYEKKIITFFDSAINSSPEMDGEPYILISSPISLLEAIGIKIKKEIRKKVKINEINIDYRKAFKEISVIVAEHPKMQQGYIIECIKEQRDKYSAHKATEDLSNGTLTFWEERLKNYPKAIDLIRAALGWDVVCSLASSSTPENLYRLMALWLICRWQKLNLSPYKILEKIAECNNRLLADIKLDKDEDMLDAELIFRLVIGIYCRENKRYIPITVFTSDIKKLKKRIQFFYKELKIFSHECKYQFFTVPGTVYLVDADTCEVIEKKSILEILLEDRDKTD